MYIVGTYDFQQLKTQTQEDHRQTTASLSHATKVHTTQSHTHYTNKQQQTIEKHVSVSIIVGNKIQIVSQNILLCTTCTVITSDLLNMYRCTVYICKITFDLLYRYIY